MGRLEEKQYSNVKDFLTLLRLEISEQRIYNVINERTRLIGQEYGFDDMEIQEIIEECFNEMKNSLYHK